jgi:hypothetical protein
MAEMVSLAEQDAAAVVTGRRTHSTIFCIFFGPSSRHRPSFPFPAPAGHNYNATQSRGVEEGVRDHRIGVNVVS